MARKAAVNASAFLNPMTTKKALAIAMRENGHTWTQIQAATGMSRSTLTILFRDPMAAVPLEMVNALRQVEDAKLTAVAHAALDQLLDDPTKMEKATAQQLVTTAAISIDKRELLAGRETARIETTLSDDQIHDELRRLRTELDTLGGEAAISAEFTDVEEAEVEDGDGGVVVPEPVPDRLLPPSDSDSG